jgi:hypothetical protein
VIASNEEEIEKKKNPEHRVWPKDIPSFNVSTHLSLSV